MSPAGPGAERKGSDLVKVYVVLFALFSAGLGYLLLRFNSQRAEYEQARLESERLLTSRPEARQRDGTPTTVYDLGKDILQFLETYQAAALKSGETGSVLPLGEITERARAAFIEIPTSTPVQQQPNNAKRYVEYSSTFTAKPVPNLENFAKFLYNLEASSTSIRVLELNWTLDPKAPYPPGNAILQPTFRLGVRKPMTSDKP
jgi:hypothetical protein